MRKYYESAYVSGILQSEEASVTGRLFILSADIKRHKRNEALSMADNKSREIGKLHVKVEVDVSEALTGLKALQREAKATIKALRELEDIKRCDSERMNGVRK